MLSTNDGADHCQYRSRRQHACVRHEPVQPALRNRRLERIDAIDDSRVHLVFDHNARALAQCVRDRGDRDGAFRAAVGSFDSREPKEREAGPLWAADAFVRLHAEVESTLSGRHIAASAVQPISQRTRATSG
jgi:hypothetical protein